MPLKALKSLGKKHNKSLGDMEQYWNQCKKHHRSGIKNVNAYCMAVTHRRAAGSGSKNPNEFIERLDKRLAEELHLEASINYQGQVFNVGVPDKFGNKPLYSRNGFQHVGNIKTDQTIDLWGKSTAKAELNKPKVPPITGWQLTWEEPPGTGAKTGRFIPFTKEDPACVACDGAGFTWEGNPLAPEKKRCHNCHGVGRINKRLEQFIKVLQKRGSFPAAAPVRGKSQRYPLFGSDK